MKKLQNNKSGFTIIEVLIVLAIAGLIMLIVFLAVPALQRNSRNTTRRNDAAKVLGLVTEFGSVNNGGVPTGAQCFGPNAVLTGPTGTQQVNVATAHYCVNSATVTWGGTGAGSNPNNPDTLQLRASAACDGTTGNAVAGPARSVVALFTLEGGALQCQAT
jgi:prepilin-type N-terminal cleavage/methylation domain-containing protein